LKKLGEQARTMKIGTPDGARSCAGVQLNAPTYHELRTVKKGGKMKKVFVIGMILALSAPGFAQWEIDRKMTDYATFDDYGSKNNAWTIAVQDTFVHITWEHRSGFPGRLYHVRSTDCGETFGAHQQVIAQDCHCSSICLSGSYVHIVWQDERGGNFKIYYVRSSDYGVTWDVVDHCITADLNYSGYPSICCSDNFVHIVWCDNRPGNDEMAMQRYTTNGQLMLERAGMVTPD
jgi:hypothetical protein